jgi:hypothetical protein
LLPRGAIAELSGQRGQGAGYDRYDRLICCFQVVVGDAFIETPKNFTGRIYEELLLQRGLPPGIKISD